ncbi:MAG: glycosyltransferase family A protein [Bacteroidota bacterium]
MNSQPFVTVLLPVYNAQLHVRQSIESVLGQTFPNFELLIINDGSTDDSEKEILSYTDARIRYYENESNAGLIATLNWGMELASGKYIVRMDADDICMPDRIQKQVQFMETHHKVGVCGCCADVIGKPNIKMKYDAHDASIRIKMLYQCHMLHPSIILRKDLLDKLGLRYNPAFVHAEDYELFCRLGKFTKLANLTETLLLYREHEGSVSRIYQDVQTKNSLEVIQQQFKDLGMEIDETEVDLFKGLMNSRFDFAEKEVYVIENLLEKIIAANRQSKNLDEALLETILFQKWKDLLMNVTRFGLNIYRLGMNSHLSKLGNFTVTEKVKLSLKSLLKL